METILVDVWVPAVQQSFEVKMPHDMNTQVAAVLAGKAIAPLTGGAFAASKSNRLASRKTGALLNPEMTLRQAKVINGSCMLLI